MCRGWLALLTPLPGTTHETHVPPYVFFDAFVMVVGLVALLFVPGLRYLCSSFRVAVSIHRCAEHIYVHNERNASCLGRSKRLDDVHAHTCPNKQRAVVEVAFLLFVTVLCRGLYRGFWRGGSKEESTTVVCTAPRARET